MFVVISVRENKCTTTKTPYTTFLSDFRVDESCSTHSEGNEVNCVDNKGFNLQNAMIKTAEGEEVAVVNKSL